MDVGAGLPASGESAMRTSLLVAIGSSKYIARVAGTSAECRGAPGDWTDRLGYRGAHEVEKPAGEWNQLEVVVTRDRITNILNGVVVNVGTIPTYTRGKIIIQSEGAEIFVRRVDLYLDGR